MATKVICRVKKTIPLGSSAGVAIYLECQHVIVKKVINGSMMICARCSRIGRR